MSKYHDDNSQASDPGGVRLAPWRFRRLEPTAGGLRGWWWRQFRDGRQFEEMLDEHLNLGDSRAACVIALDPLLVAAYTDELDCIVPLAFPAWLATEHRLAVGTRLLTVNTYGRGPTIAPDLHPGPETLNRYANFFPVIAEFFSDSHDRINARKASIDAREWYRCAQMGQDYRQRFPHTWRAGSPLHSDTPAALAGRDRRG